MKRAIIVQGQSGSGKTTTIRWIFRWLRLYYKPTISNFWDNGDLSCDLLIGGLNIRLCSAGDEGPFVHDYLTNAIASNANIIIGACRGKGSTNQAMLHILDPYGRSKPVVTSFVKTYHHSSPKAFNKRCAQELRTLLIGLH